LLGFWGWIGFITAWMGRGLYGFAKAKTRMGRGFLTEMTSSIYKGVCFSYTFL
jgi:hypothetical protein